MKRQGRLVAVDRYEDRLARLRENLARAGVSAHEKKTRKGGESPAFVRVLRADLTEADDTLRSGGLAPERGFDGVLLDVPCSNTGVLRRRPDARWRFSMPRLAKLVSLQRALLDTAGRLVRPGGRLVYSTCSLEPEECEAMVASWKQDHGDFDVSTEVRLFPPDTGTDGAYAARLQRRPLRP
jgi:16S rRNA (cytosine967-C5)-methyltransferase